jgi:dipeptidyl aminopeptidase/acylaminoacyl peptidase
LLVVQTLSFAQQNTARFTIEQALGSPFPSDLVASRNGQRIAWVFDAEGRRNIWVAEAPQFEARQLTRYNDDDGQEITDVAFNADGDKIVYVRGGNKIAPEKFRIRRTMRRAQCRRFTPCHGAAAV